MKKILDIILGIAIYFICVVLFMGYGHTETHVPLNTSIALRFLELTITNSIIDKLKFKNYEFNWNNDKQPTLVGPAITKDYYTSYSESDEENLGYTPVEWVSKGGWMEDEPWGPASLCHFYDPLGIDNGKKYLTDNSGKLEWLASIPKEWFSRDAKSWATSYSENKYGWRQAKEYVVKALKEDNMELRKNDMAKAYRCLGQTLHLVSDMGCPPHVRNDSHPPQVSFLVGDPDPYEDICKKLDTYTLVKATAPNSRLKSQFDKTEKFGDIFESLALFTNQNFYSGGTINTDRYKPSVRPDNPYPSPLLTELDYNKSEYTYYKTLEGNLKVKMCKDKTAVPFPDVFGKDSTRGRPYIDYECAESMASVIMPNVVEAGANVIRLFVPSLNLDITEAKSDSGGIIRGKVSYSLPSLDDEYSGLFDLNNIYNGPVSLFVNGSDTQIKVNAKKNNFEFKLDNKISNLKKDDIAIAKVDFGGIVLKSDEKKITAADIKSNKTFNYSLSVLVHYKSIDDYGTPSSGDESFSMHGDDIPYTQKGNTITASWNDFEYPLHDTPYPRTSKATFILESDNTLSFSITSSVTYTYSTGITTNITRSATGKAVPRYINGLEEMYHTYRKESYKVLQTVSYKEVGSKGHTREITGFFNNPTNNEFNDFVVLFKY